MLQNIETFLLKRSAGVLYEPRLRRLEEGDYSNRLRTLPLRFGKRAAPVVAISLKCYLSPESCE